MHFLEDLAASELQLQTRSLQYHPAQHRSTMWKFYGGFRVHTDRTNSTSGHGQKTKG